MIGLHCLGGPGFSNYNGKNFMLGSLDFHRYTGNIVEPNIVKSGFCSIQFTVTFAGTQKVDR